MPANNNSAFVKNAIDAAAKIFLIGLLLVTSYHIIQPFLMPVVWAAILAVAFNPFINKFSKLLGGRRKIACILFSLTAVAILVLPVIGLASSSVDVIKEVATDLHANKADFIKPAPAKIAEIPVIGKKLSETWNLAAQDFKGAITSTSPLAQNLAKKLFSSVGGGVATILQFVISFIIAGILLINPEKGFAASSKIARSLAGTQGEEFTKLTIATIRGVMNGVVGVAIIQAVLGTIGMLIMGIPGAGIWGLLVLVCAIIQLPPIIILGPIAAYGFATHDTVPAVIFLIWAILVSASDGVIKPILMARGVDTPMLVILIGAIGGMMLSGIIGLFVGAVILSITYTIFMAWVDEKDAHLSITNTQPLED